MVPLFGLRKDGGIVGADLFLQFAQGRGSWVFSLANAALRHLPCTAFNIVAAAQEHATLLVEQHNPDARTIPPRLAWKLMHGFGLRGRPFATGAS